MKAVFKARWPLAVAVLLIVAPCVRADSWTFSLDPPGGAISGVAGSTIGWGYTITNQSATNWLVLAGLSAGSFANATPDASLFTFPIIAPGATFAVVYNPITLEGLFQIMWDANAPVGFTNIGVFVLSAEFWDADPLAQANANFVSLALDQSAGYSATVAAPPTTPIPEPATLLLTGIGAAGILLRRRRCKPGPAQHVVPPQ